MDAVPGNVDIIAFELNAICGKINPTAAIHPAGRTEYDLSPITFKASRTAILAPHPGQAL
jgi:hypothetical protein